MLLKRGIVRKTFLYSMLLILVVVLISFAAMYFVMPGYYLEQKQRALFGRSELLAESLRAASSEGECAALISDFSEANNVSILSLDENEMLLPALSSPFMGMLGEEDAVFFAGERMESSQIFQIQIRRNRATTDSHEPTVAIKWAAERNDDVINLMNKVRAEWVDLLLISGTLQPIDEAKGVILSLIPYVLIIAVAAGVILSGIYARQISKPILRISQAALRMQRMEPDAVSDLRTKDELGQLSANLDVLYAKLRENIDHLQKEMDKAGRLERSKTEMMQSASHELKTPIAALSGMLEGMIDNVGVYKDKEKYLVQCKNQVDRLSCLAGEILGASRADLSGEELELSDIYLDELVERAIAENIYQIHEKGLRLVRELPSASVSTDAGILYHAVSNLVSNAVRYTPAQGEIRISIADGEEGCRLIIENECEPIRPEELPKLFEPFYTRSYSRDKTKSGTGLGLYIAKRSLQRLAIPYEAEIAGLGFRISLTI